MLGANMCWLRIGTDGGHLWIRWWTFGFHNVRAISWLAAEPVSFSRRTLLHGVSKYIRIYIYVCIYIYIERERETERVIQNQPSSDNSIRRRYAQFQETGCVCIPELKVRIRTATETITADMLQTVWNELDYRVDVCRITKGAHIELLQGL